MRVPDIGASHDIPRRTAHAALALLMLAAAFSFLDRQILTLLVQPIKADLGITDTQIGVLQGFSFAVLFSVMAMPAGWLVDRVSRWRVAAGGIALWSLATAASGLCDSFAQLLSARMVVGIGEAALMPAAYSLLADYYSAKERGRVFAIYSLAIFAGAGGSMMIGGIVIHLLGAAGSVSMGPLGARSVWQATFLIVGLPGLALAAVLAMVRDPPRRAMAPGLSKGVGTAVGFWRYVRRHRMTFGLVWAAYTLVGFAAYAVVPWAPVALGREYGVSPAAAGILSGAIQLPASIIGCLLAGMLGDRWTRQDKLGAKFRLVLAMWLGAFPGLILFSSAGRLSLALLGLFMFSLSNAAAYVSASAVIQDMVPGEFRGQTTGFWYLVTGILGNGAGPFATAMMAEDVLGAGASLGNAMLLTVTPAALAGLVVSLAGLRPYDRLRRDVALAAARTTPAAWLTLAGRNQGSEPQPRRSLARPDPFERED